MIDTAKQVVILVTVVWKSVDFQKISNMATFSLKFFGKNGANNPPVRSYFQ